ncbi:MAG TPA: YjgP/YjgQ family permease [Bacteroidetes bacterium]|nr:YjgP/YjgQ family permease [Bacteroidota bacterium]HEX04102.1 YjgP/YjgQ family permease [Bacteroidota bacterium]
MFTTLDRYIVREHIAPFFISNALIMFIFTLNLALQMLGRIVGKGLEPMLIAEFFWLNLAWILTLSVPMSVLVACLMGFGRLAGDHEIVAMKAAGIGITRMIRPVLIAGVLVGAFSLYFQDQILPDMNYRNKLLTTSIKRKQPNVVIREGTFTREIPKQTLLVREIDPETELLTDVTIFDESNPNQPTTILAETGKMSYVDSLGMFLLKLYEGEIHQTERNDPEEYQIMQFGEALFRTEDTDQLLQRREGGYRGDRELGLAALTERVNELRARTEPDRYERQINRYLVEYHKKWSISFAAIIFVLIGAPLGIKLTHGGLGVSGPLSVVFFLLYWTFLIGGEDMADRGLLAPWLSMWAPNFLLGALGWFMIYLETRTHKTYRFPWQKKREEDGVPDSWSSLSGEQIDQMAAEEQARQQNEDS